MIYAVPLLLTIAILATIGLMVLTLEQHRRTRAVVGDQILSARARADERHVEILAAIGRLGTESIDPMRLELAAIATSALTEATVHDHLEQTAGAIVAELNPRQRWARRPRR